LCLELINPLNFTREAIVFHEAKPPRNTPVKDEGSVKVLMVIMDNEADFGVEGFKRG
jgi:hypothetical protein